MDEKHLLFDELLVPHLDAAYNLARWIVEKDHDAQDVVQEAYVRALKGFKHFRGVNARAWLLTTVRNTAYSWLKRRRHDLNMVSFDEALHTTEHDEVLSESEHEARAQILREALSKLPTEYREVLMLYEIERWSYKQLASALNVPIGTVMSRLSRARQRLRREIDEARQEELLDEL